MGVVYEAYDCLWNQRVALKTLRNLTAAALLRFKHEFRALADVSHPNLATLYELVSSEQLWFFTMELVEGTSFMTFVRGAHYPPRRAPLVPAPIARICAPTEDTRKTLTTAHEGAVLEQTLDPEQGAALSLPRSAVTLPPPTGPLAPPARLERLRPAAAQLAAALIALHQSGHLHRDVKPSNVMVTHDGRVVVLDFGVVTTLDPARRSPAPRGRAGTVVYMAPEMFIDGSKVSTAADWYSFGVMLYEALAGRRPFANKKERRLAAKFADAPPRPSIVRPGIPDDLDQLCVELLRVDPGQRPTGPEVLARLSAPDSRPGKLQAVPPLSAATVTEEHFVGRKEELARLEHALERVRQGQGSALLLQGRSGMGKSALARHFLDHVEDAVILEGRCYERETVPYKALDSIVDALCTYLAQQSESVQAAALPEDASALVHAFPVLERLGKLKRLSVGDVASMAPAELRRRAFAALRELLTRLARRQTLVLFIDDLQWGDAESASVLVELMQRPAAPLLLLAAYRSEQAEGSQLLQALFAARRGDPDFAAHVHDVRVDPLDDEQCRQLTGSLLSAAGASDRSEDILREIETESQGNPYFIQEFVRFAVPRSSHQLGRLDLDSMILTRVGELSAPGRRLLESIAVAGWRLPQQVACHAADLGEQRLRALGELRAGHFVRTHGAGKWARTESYHDRVREAVAAALTEDEQCRIHARIASALEQWTEEGPEKTYALANHLFLAHEPKERQRAFELNYAAGRMAFDTFAYEQAHRLLQQAYEIGRAIGLETDPRLYQLLGDASARTGRVGEAMHFLKQALNRSSAAGQRAMVRYSISKLYLGQLDSSAARVEVARALEELGYVHPRKNPLHILGTLLAWIRGWWSIKRGTHRRLSPEQRDQHQVAAALYVHAGYTAYFEMDMIGLVSNTLRAYGAAARSGRTQMLADSYILLGVIVAAKGGYRRAVWLGDQAIAVSAALGNPVATARIQVYRSFIAHFVGDTRNARQRAEQALEAHARLLENVDYLTGVADLSWNLLMRGYAHDGWKWTERGLRRSALSGRTAENTQGHTYRCYAGPLLTMLGRHEEGMAHLAEFRQLIVKTPQDKWRWGQYLAHSALALVLQGETGDALDQVIARHRLLKLPPSRVPLQLRQFYVAQAYARLWQYRQATGSAVAICRKQLRYALRQLRKTGYHVTLHAHRLCVEASTEGYEGRIDQALRHLNQAEAIARRNDNAWVLAEVEYQHALILRSKGQEQRAQDKARAMLRFATKLGWEPRAKQVCEEFGLGQGLSPASPGCGSSRQG